MSTDRKVAFITGANKGIGLETARGLGKLGIAVGPTGGAWCFFFGLAGCRRLGGTMFHAAPVKDTGWNGSTPSGTSSIGDVER